MQNSFPAIAYRQGACFRYAVPQGWKVTEDGSHAVVLAAPDDMALTIMVGATAVPGGHNPSQFIFDHLARAFANPRLAQPQPAQPVMGLQHAVLHQVAFFSSLGHPFCGTAKCSFAVNYDGSCNMVATCAVAHQAAWGGYAQWLPQLADDVQPTNSGAFGRGMVMQQNAHNEAMYQQQVSQYRDWSQATWQGVTDYRNQVQDRQHAEFRENLGAVQTFVNPYDSRTVELSTELTYHWINRQGQIVSTNDPGENPNVGSTLEWTRMPLVRR